MIGIVWFLVGILISAILSVLIVFTLRKRAFGSKKNERKEIISESENTAYMKQYINFLNYDGSGKGQKSIEN